MKEAHWEVHEPLFNNKKTTYSCRPQDGMRPRTRLKWRQLPRAATGSPTCVALTVTRTDVKRMSRRLAASSVHAASESIPPRSPGLGLAQGVTQEGI